MVATTVITMYTTDTTPLKSTSGTEATSMASSTQLATSETYSTSNEGETSVSEVYTTFNQTSLTTAGSPGEDPDKLVIIYSAVSAAVFVIVIIIIITILKKRRKLCCDTHSSRPQPNMLQHPIEIDQYIHRHVERPDIEMQQANQKKPAEMEPSSSSSPFSPSYDEHMFDQSHEQCHYTNSSQLAADNGSKIMVGGRPTIIKEDLNISESIQGLNKLSIAPSVTCQDENYAEMSTAQDSGHQNRYTYQNMNEIQLTDLERKPTMDHHITDGKKQVKGCSDTYVNIDVVNCLKQQQAKNNEATFPEQIYENNEAVRNAISKDIYDNDEAARNAISEDIYDNNEAARRALSDKIWNDNYTGEIYDNYMVDRKPHHQQNDSVSHLKGSKSTKRKQIVSQLPPEIDTCSSAQH